MPGLVLAVVASPWTRITDSKLAGGCFRSDVLSGERVALVTASGDRWAWEVTGKSGAVRKNIEDSRELAKDMADRALRNIGYRTTRMPGKHVTSD